MSDIEEEILGKMNAVQYNIIDMADHWSIFQNVLANNIMHTISETKMYKLASNSVWHIKRCPVMELYTTNTDTNMIESNLFLLKT